MKHTLVLANRIDELPKLQDFVGVLAEDLSLDDTMVFNLNLVLEELATNIVLYAYPKGEEHTFEIEADARDGVLRFRLMDHGAPFDPLNDAPDVDVSLDAEEREIGGLGIFLVQQLMDDVAYERIAGANVLTLTKNL